MNAIFDRYPVYEANQVLTSGHLNDGFDYADEQTRLTRSNLIGIGIVCGLTFELDVAAAAINLTKGCGVTSQGYLIIEPQDVSLVASRAYTLPPDIDYPPFKTGGGAQVPLWELFPAGEPNTVPLDEDESFLADKAVLLFLELRKQGLRNCSPNNCDDKGLEVTATVRRLLIATADLDQIIAAANELGSALTAADIDAALAARLNLPDIRVRRFDVVNTTPATSNDVYAAFLNVFRSVRLAHATGQALNAAYAAFRPLLLAKYPVSPFKNFETRFGFLDGVPASATQVRFLQYYVDLFEDLVRAYDEFRWKGVKLLCACCPPDGLFPRHLMLGLLHPETSAQPGRYRQPFLPSPAVGNCVEESKELLALFARLVQMAANFTNAPALPAPNEAANVDPQIRVTPSVLGDEPLAARAIPYYYRQNGSPPLYHLWDGEKTRHNRANRNLAYRYDEYSPTAPPFVADPLRYDLERHDFLRVEGHLGKGYQQVLGSLLALKTRYRLPIDVIALRTGAYDDTQPVDLTQESARFQDLEALYDALREELLSSLAVGAMDLYDTLIDSSTLPGGVPKLSLLKGCMPHYRYPAASVGAFYEKHLQSLQAVPYIDVDQTLMSDESFAGEVFKVWCILFAGKTGLPEESFAQVVCIFYFSKLAEILPERLDALAYKDFENKYQDLLALVRYFRSGALKQLPATLKNYAPQLQLIDDFSEVLHGCKLEAIESVHLEYVRRLGALKKRQYLSDFLQHHPGIQHKAGVPTGGTFVVVYHGVPRPPLPPRDFTILNTVLFADEFARETRLSRMMAAADTPARASTAEPELHIAQVADALKESNVKGLALTEAISRVSSDKTLAQDPNVSFILDALTGKFSILEGLVNVPEHGLDARAAQIIASTVNGLTDGAVIADFFLPYRICSDVPGAQYVLPKSPPIFSATTACTNSEGFASVTVDVRGGDAPYDISVDDGAYKALARKTLSLRAGEHTLKIRDSMGSETAAQSITIPGPIVLSEPAFTCQDETYTATFRISGGTPPYSVDGTAVAGDDATFTTDRVASGASVTVEVRDSVECSVSKTFTHTCPPVCRLPCAGIALRRGFRMWLPDGDPENPYLAYDVGRVVFKFEGKPGQTIDLSAQVRRIITADPAELSRQFPAVVKRWLDAINKLVRDATRDLDSGVQWFALSYEPSGAGRLGALGIEYFECLGFEIRIETTIALRRLERQSTRVAYDPTGTTLEINDHKTTIPPFGGAQIDKCDPAMPEKAICGRPPRAALSVDVRPGRGTAATFAVRPTDARVAFVWEAQNATPAMGSGAEFATTFAPGTVVGTVLVTAFDEVGCPITGTGRVAFDGTPPPARGGTPIGAITATPAGPGTPTVRRAKKKTKRTP
jgi:hypothetical protein